MIFPGLSAYSISKLVTNQISAYLEAEYPHATSVSLHPRFVKTDMTFDALEPLPKDTPELVGAFGVWLNTVTKSF